MSSSICFLFGAGEYYDSYPIMPKTNDYIIAVDGGYNYNKQMGITPHLLIGDFDSISSSSDISEFKGELLQFSPHKDYTDMHLAVKEGIKRGYSCFVIYGGLGGRTDHLVANLQLLAWISARNITAYLIGDNQVITAITNSSISYPDILKKNRSNKLLAPAIGKYISVLSHTNESKGVTITGLEYEIKDAHITNEFAIGTSNSFVSENYSISVKEGTLLIISEYR
ncbi:MAG: thiamine diphosphokinase [Lachnospiraceae bacterium]|nr:thiamine diphosphokinase [Lachnospiraceae bacterium]